MPRQGISDEQQKALRDWFQRQYPRPRQKDCIAWFFQQYNHRISQSTVSECTSDHYKHLDVKQPPKKTFRQRTPNWPILEDILYNWQQLIERRGGLVNALSA